MIRLHSCSFVAAFFLLRSSGLCQTATPSSDAPVAHFGTTVVLSNGLRGDIYFLDPDLDKLPYFDLMRPVGAIYTTELNVPPHDFRAGFPGVTNRFEWFAIDYKGAFWIDKPGKYKWALLSDDGSKLYIDNHEIINNDGTHPARGIAGNARLKRGEHRIRVSYFQGPAYHVALILAVIPPGEKEYTVFDTDDYLSPKALAELKETRPDDPRFTAGGRPYRKPASPIVIDPISPVH